MTAKLSTADGERRVLMTLRVSRDSGRTWGPRTVILDDQGQGSLPSEPMRFPPCRCPRCLNRLEADGVQ